MRCTYISVAVIALAAFALILWKHGSPDTTRDWLIMAVASLAGGVGGMVAGTVVSMISILVASTKTNGILGEHRYEIRSDGLFEKTDANESLNRWSGIREIRRLGSFLIFRISDYQFHVVPKRSFESEAAFLEFLENARGKWHQAVSAPQPGRG
jgi:hypothetical protein